MRGKFIAISIVLLASFSTIAQKKKQKQHLTFDYQLVVENDAFTGNLTKDQYYSSGIYPRVRWLIDSGKTVRRIFSAGLNHRMYTPSWIGWENQNQLDRPYAGQISASGALEHYFATNQYLKLEVELGWMGPGALVGETQATWHQWFGMPEPKGWKYQINNTPIISVYATYIRPFYSSPHFDMASESSLALGTVFNYFRQELVFRAGKINPLHQSAYVSASPGNKRGKKQANTKTAESYFFYSPGLEYVLYNATIEGNFIGESSVYTEEAYHWVWQHRAGVMFSWPRFDLGLIAYWRTVENTNATNHNYVGIRMNQRF